MSRDTATHAHRHVVLFKLGVWRTATRRERCSRFFGSLQRCVRVIRVGRRYFDTQMGHHVCLGCGTHEVQREAA